MVRERAKKSRLTALVVGFVALLVATKPGQAADVLASRNDDGRTGANLDETILTAENVRRDFGFLFHFGVDADVYAQPLFASDLDMPGRGKSDSVDALHEVRPGVLRAYAALTLDKLWTCEDRNQKNGDGQETCAPNDNPATCDRVGTFAKFVPPTVANGRVYLAPNGCNGKNDCGIKVYGLLHHEYLRPGQIPAASLKGAEWMLLYGPARRRSQ